MASYVKILVHATPADAGISIDGKPMYGSFSVKRGSTANVSVAQVGYVTENRTVTPDADTTLAIDLRPEPLHISVSTSEPSGSVFLDGNPQGDLQDGEWFHEFPLKDSEEEHVLSGKGKAGELFKISFKAAAAKTPLVDPVKSKDIIVASSLGKEAILYGSSTQPVEGDQRIVPGGLTINLEKTVEGKITQPVLVEAGNAPTLSVSLNGTSNVIPVTISSTPKTAKLFINGQAVRTKKQGYWTLTKSVGTYKAKLTADGMEDDNFLIALKKGDAPPTFNREMKKSGPVMGTLVVEDCTAGATVLIDKSPIDQLVDDKGHLTYPGVVLGTHSITLAKPGYASQTFSGKVFSANNSVLVSGIKLFPSVGHVRFSIKPANATVRFRKPGEESHIVDVSKILDLSPGNYEFTAEAEGFDSQTQPLEIKPEVTTPFAVTLHESTKTAKEETKELVDPTLVISNGSWFTGRNKDFIPLLAHQAKTTLGFLKGGKVKKMVWRISLDNGNNITYNLDSKGLSITSVLDGIKAPTEKLPLDMSGTGNASEAYVIRIQLLSNGVRLSKQDESEVEKISDEKHDWRRATIYVKGDATFTVWPGQ